MQYVCVMRHERSSTVLHDLNDLTLVRLSTAVVQVRSDNTHFRKIEK